MNGQTVTIGQALNAPAGYGVGLRAARSAVASGGSGYVAPPVVTFAAPASGVAATGVANVDQWRRHRNHDYQPRFRLYARASRGGQLQWRQ